MTNRVWFITGASQGLGLCLVKQLLAEGERVAATSRNLDKLVAAVSPETDMFLPLEMELTNESCMLDGKERIINKFGTIDVIINNAGYAIRGMVEEVSDLEARREFDGNVFSVLNVIRNFSGVLRGKRSGYIINVSSIAGYKAVKWSGIYGASKYAVEGITEALRQELEPFGVKVFSVNPGDLRTSFHDPDKMIIAQTQIDDYLEMRTDMSAMVKGKHGRQISDPMKVAMRIIDLAKEQTPPRNFFVGSDSFATAKTKTASVDQELEQWKEVSCSVGFQDEA